MKKYLLFIALLLTCGPALFAQITPDPYQCGISFTYDNAGNRIQRYLCQEWVELEYERSERGHQVVSEISLEEMLDEAGFSESMEAEIEELEALLATPNSLDLQSVEEESVKVELTEENFQDLSDLILFPNPTMSTFSIKDSGLSPEATVSILDMNARILSQRSLGDGRGIDVSSLPDGTYLVTLMHKDVRKLALLVKTAENR